MKKYGYNAYYKYKVQKMSDEHKERREECARMFLSYQLRVLLIEKKFLANFFFNYKNFIFEVIKVYTRKGHS